MANKNSSHLQAVDKAYFDSRGITKLMFPYEEVTEDMAQISREEIHALLAANKAEMESIASSIRAEMAISRENTGIQFAALNSAIASLSSKIEGKMDSVDGDVKAINGKFEGIQGQITGLSTAISGIQSGISTRLAVFSVIIAVLVALPGIISSLRDAPHPSSVQPLVIQLTTPQSEVSQAPPPARLEIPDPKAKP